MSYTGRGPSPPWGAPVAQVGPAVPLPPPRPGWVTALGIISIVLGSLSILSSAYNVAMPAMMRMQQQMMEGMEEAMTAMATHPATTHPTTWPAGPPAGPPPQIFRMWHRMFHVPAWVEVALYVTSATGVLLGGLCVASGAGMLGLRPWSRTLGIVFAVGSIIEAFAVMFVSLAGGCWMLWGWTCGSVVALAYPIVLLCFLLPAHRAAVFRVRRG